MSEYNELINIDIKGKNILLREDLNVPVENNKIVNDARLQAAIPTINYALAKKSKLAIIFFNEFNIYNISIFFL